MATVRLSVEENRGPRVEFHAGAIDVESLLRQRVINLGNDTSAYRIFVDIVNGGYVLGHSPILTKADGVTAVVTHMFLCLRQGDITETDHRYARAFRYAEHPQVF